MSISIIVPVLNEAVLIQSFLENLRERASGAEVIVVDGGSSDGTAQKAIGLCDRVVQTTAGRGRQKDASGSVGPGGNPLVFHAGATNPKNALSGIQRAL